MLQYPILICILILLILSGLACTSIGVSPKDSGKHFNYRQNFLQFIQTKKKLHKKNVKILKDYNSASGEMCFLVKYIKQDKKTIFCCSDSRWLKIKNYLYK